MACLELEKEAGIYLGTHPFLELLCKVRDRAVSFLVDIKTTQPLWRIARDNKLPEKETGTRNYSEIIVNIEEQKHKYLLQKLNWIILLVGKKRLDPSIPPPPVFNYLFNLLICCPSPSDWMATFFWKRNFIFIEPYYTTIFLFATQHTVNHFVFSLLNIDNHNFMDRIVSDWTKIGKAVNLSKTKTNTGGMKKSGKEGRVYCCCFCCCCLPYVISGLQPRL